jgi:hypothetical protein
VSYNIKITVRIATGEQNLKSTRVSLKKTKKNFGTNRNKPKLSLFRLIFGLFRETKQIFFRFVSVFKTVSKQSKQIVLLRNRQKTKKTPESSVNKLNEKLSLYS